LYRFLGVRKNCLSSLLKMLVIMSKEKYLLLSFDTEEFDVPLEHKVDFPLEKGMAVSTYGANIILDVLKHNGVRATFFCTANFAIHAPDVMKRIMDEGHEVASHGFHHWTFDVSDLKKSKDKLEELTGRKIRGYRQARMMPVPETKIAEAGYEYNSSLNPTFIPGRYMHLSTPRTYFMKQGVMQIPASVTPCLRFPLFWLAYHNLPAALYRSLVSMTLNYDGYFVTYFHPWEFYPLGEHPEFKMPFIIRNHSGKGMKKRLDKFLKVFQAKGAQFITFSEFVDKKK
jgi:peptidoglycan/xylan/chitin deacetylase (PgdA/CDA1 family)